MSDWVRLLETFGLATVIVLFLGVCIWRCGGWVGEHVITPLVGRYLRLLDALIISVTKQGEALTRVGEAMEKLSNTLDMMGKHTVESMDRLDQIVDKLAEIECCRSEDKQGQDKEVKGEGKEDRIKKAEFPYG